MFSILTKLKILNRGLKYRHILNYVNIEGWLSIDEAIELYNLANSLPINDTVVVEIGALLGKSSLVLAKAIENKQSPKLYCIDPFYIDLDSYDGPTYAKWKHLLNRTFVDQFALNMQKSNVFAIIEILKGYSYDFVDSFSRKIDLLFLDGNHEYEAVLRDFLDWSPLIKPNGIIVFHDVTEKKGCEGPWLVIDQHIRNNPQWRNLKLVGTLFSARKKSS